MEKEMEIEQEREIQTELLQQSGNKLKTVATVTNSQVKRRVKKSGPKYTDVEFTVVKHFQSSMKQ